MKNNRKVRAAIIVSIGLIIYNLLVSVLVYVEQMSLQSNIIGFSEAYKYSIVVISTLSYGDLFPVTTYGQIIGYGFILLSLVFYAFVIGGIYITLKRVVKLVSTRTRKAH